jgi:Protein of unknown function (DUF2840)
MASAMHRVAPLIARPSELTHVELLWVKKRFENWIRFGQVEQEHRLDSQWRVVSFAAGSVFAFVRWAANDYGTVLSRLDILRAVGPRERYSTVPYVRPGGESLLRASGAGQSYLVRQNRHLLIDRARHLERYDLATETEPGRWTVSSRRQ